MRDQQDCPALSAAALRVLREDQPSEREVDTAYRRFARKPQRRAPALLVSRWVVAGLVMGLGLAFGAEAVVQKLDARPPTAQPALITTPVARKTTALGTPQPSEPSSVERVEPAEQSPTLPPEPKPARATSSASPKASALDSDDRPSADSAVWTKAAQGLRDNDLAATQAALATLEQAGSATDREAARLIRAQLMLHQGDANSAQALLRDLASNAQSAQVRAKARSLLDRSAIKSNSALNVAPTGT